jgi:hypothetical protein
MKRTLSRKQKIAARIRWRNWSRKNRKRVNRNMRNYRARRYALDGYWRESGPVAVALKKWYEVAKSKPCADCGHSFPACCMDFDHRIGTEKSYCVGTMVAHHYSLNLIEKEVAKCDLVCANCHRIRTRDRRKGRPRSNKQ